MIIVGLFAKWQPTTLFSDMYRILFQWLLRFADYDPRLLGWWCTRHDNDDYYYYCGLVTKTFAQLLYTHSRHYLSDVIPGHISNHPLHLLGLHPFDQQAEAHGSGYKFATANMDRIIIISSSPNRVSFVRSLTTHHNCIRPDIHGPTISKTTQPQSLWLDRKATPSTGERQWINLLGREYTYTIIIYPIPTGTKTIYNLSSLASQPSVTPNRIFSERLNAHETPTTHYMDGRLDEDRPAEADGY